MDTIDYFIISLLTRVFFAHIGERLEPEGLNPVVQITMHTWIRPRSSRLPFRII